MTSAEMAYSKSTRLGDGLPRLSIIEMGARQYSPVLGRFLEVDPVEGGNANDYIYPYDPVNGRDLTGECWGGYRKCSSTAQRPRSRPAPSKARLTGRQMLGMPHQQPSLFRPYLAPGPARERLDPGREVIHRYDFGDLYDDVSGYFTSPNRAQAASAGCVTGGVDGAATGFLVFSPTGPGSVAGAVGLGAGGCVVGGVTAFVIWPWWPL